MSDSYRNIADVIDVLTDLNCYVTHVEHSGEPEDYGTFQLTVEVPHYERIEVEE
jgi:hypothetical protein